MKKKNLLGMVLGLVGFVTLPAMADMSTNLYSKTVSGNVGAGNGYIKMTISYLDGSAFDLSSFTSSWYGDTDQTIDVLHLDQNKDIKITVEYKGVGDSYHWKGLKLIHDADVGADFVAWNGAGTSSHDGVIFEKSDYIEDVLTNSWNIIAGYNGTKFTIKDAPWCGCNSASITTDKSVFDIFAQLNDTIGHDKLGIGVRLDFTKAESVGGGTVVPAPAAMLLGSMGLALVGWVKRRYC